MKIRILPTALCLIALLAPLPFMLEKASATDDPVVGDKAQGTPRLDRHLVYLTNALALTVEQQALIRSILTAEAGQLAEIRESSALSEEEKRGKLRAVRSATHTQIRQVLTPDQQKKYEAPFEKAAKRRKVKEGTTPVPEQGK